MRIPVSPTSNVPKDLTFIRIHRQTRSIIRKDRSTMKIERTSKVFKDAEGRYYLHAYMDQILNHHNPTQHFPVISINQWSKEIDGWGNPRKIGE